MASAREVALDCLVACEQQGAWSDGYLKSAMGRAGLDGRDAGFCTRLAFGVLQNRRLLDWYAAQYCVLALEKMDSSVRNALRLGLYQLLLLDRVPVHAAVGESVVLVKSRCRNPRSAGLVNAVLRAVERAREAGELPQPRELGVRYSHPDWLVKEFSLTVPEGELEALLAADNGQPATVAQVNTLKTTAAELEQELIDDGVTVRVHPWLPDCLELSDTGNLERLSAFREGKFYVQDAASRLAVLAAGARPGWAVLDACAAPGGKSFAAAIQMKGEGTVLSCDIHPNKVKLIGRGAERLGLSKVSAQLRNAKEFDPELEGRFELVLADVPCSGLGIIRKKPDIRYKEPGALEGLPKVQLDILENVSRYVKPGGVLLYSTCTLLERENQGVVRAFLEGHSEFRPAPFLLPGREEDQCEVTLWPHRDGTDGFFFAKMERRLERETVEALSRKYGLDAPKGKL